MWVIKCMSVCENNFTALCLLFTRYKFIVRIYQRNSTHITASEKNNWRKDIITELQVNKYLKTKAHYICELCVGLLLFLSVF